MQQLTDKSTDTELHIHKRNIKTNIRLILFPFILCLLLVLIQQLVNNELDSPSNRCGCTCVDTGNGQCERRCGVEYSDLDQIGSCPIPHPPQWPPLLQLPALQYRAVRTDVMPYGDLPDESCRRTGVAANLFSTPLNINTSDVLYSLADDALGSETMTRYTNFIDEAFFSNEIDILQAQCTSNSQFAIPLRLGSVTLQQDVRCIRGLRLWRNSSSEINNELYSGYNRGNSERRINEIVAAYDFMNSNENLFNVTVWYNSTYKNDTGNLPIALTRVPRAVNLVSNAYLEFLLGPGTRMLFEFVKEMPKPETIPRLDLSSLLGTLFFTWVIVQLFPVVLLSLVYEKQHRLRIMMKMHGLGDGPYWMISYAYFLAISSIYMLCFVIFGSLIGLNFFRLNDYSIQFVFYFIYINLQISMAFLVADLFSNVKTATVVGYIMVFGTGLLGGFLFQFFLQDSSFPRAGIIAMELFPGFSLYRGLYEFSQYAFTGNDMGTDGMRWTDLSDSNNGMREVLIIMAVEWVVVLCVAYYVDQVTSSGKSPLFFLKRRRKGLSSSFRKPSLRRQGSKVFVQLEKADVQQEMIGLIKPSSGTAYVEGLDIRTDMDRIYTSMGVCPQHDLLWETLTGREHLLFYGRLKNLKGASLTQAVEESLKSVNLFHGGVADKQAGKYSGGMKRRLSVAISLIGDPKVVYMDEPSTGLDPASRNLLWNVVKRAKQNRAIILTTHSMEEAEHLCDRLGIFVDGSLQCVGNPKELKARYGGSYVFTMTTSADHDEEVENLVRHLSPSATKIYQISGTQKFELAKQEVRISDVFQAVEKAKSRFAVQAWGLADTTLEDVFIKVARGAQAFTRLS
ncbi:ABC transporter A family member [Striga asiatica]|uniref:ABC transporter A family member n=1 Tax=Striga asiatica TaxID=4170 RepID=A0A5A7QY15_STRAF|nr:ABC transporter A family member [Striga asiatica]